MRASACRTQPGALPNRLIGMPAVRAAQRGAMPTRLNEPNAMRARLIGMPAVRVYALSASLREPSASASEAA